MSWSKILKPKSIFAACLLGGGLVLPGCGIVDKHVEWETVEPETYPVLKAIGYAPINAQTGDTESMKLIMAMKASKLDAYRELTEQVYGQQIAGSQSVSNLVMSSETMKSSVEGVIRGAKVVKTYPVGDDTYVTELTLDMKKVHDIYLTTVKPRKVKSVKYY